MNRKKMIFVAAGLLVAGLLFVILHSPQQNATIGDGKEPEKGGPSIVKLDGEAKLNSLLEPPQFFAAKNELSNFAYLKYGSNVQSISIESTNLETDGGIVLKIKIDGTKEAKATIHSTNTQFIFDVPAVNYETVTPQSVVANKYYGT